MRHAPPPIPSWQLYGERSPFPDLLHIERIADRAAGLGWRIDPHRHLLLHQLFLIRTGEVRLTLDGADIPAAPPVLINLPRGAVHGFAFSVGTEGWVLSLPAADFPELLGPGAEPLSALSRSFAACPPAGLDAAFATLADLHAGTSPLRRLRLRAAALALCCAVAETAAGSTPARGEADPRIARFEALARAHLAEGWPVARYAAALALSERHLRRLCLSATGLSAHEFIEAIRLREACRLLAYTRLRVKEVAFALGYEDPAYFARAFRRSQGLSPAAYRSRLDA